MYKFIPQYKGKALEKIPEKEIKEDGYYASLKYDGQMVQIAYDLINKKVFMWSSNGHPFYNQTLANHIIKNATNSFHVEAEYTGTSRGKLGDRGLSAKITTYRTEFAKGIMSEGNPDEHFNVFDILSYKNQDLRNSPFSERHSYLAHLAYDFIAKGNLFGIITHLPQYNVYMGIRTAESMIKKFGWEGIILTHQSHTIKSSGRSNLRIKIKETPTDYGIIVGYTPGTKERKGTIGSLTIRDENGLEFSSGTGLNHEEWSLDPESIKGITVKFGYESIKDGNYQQPRYLGAVLEDKTLVRLNNHPSLKK